MTGRKLGRGLQALLGGSENEPHISIHQPDEPAPGELRYVAPESIETNPYQPRKQFDPADLEELAASIKAHGVIQPIVVRQVGTKLQLIAGERRLRAAQAAGLAEIPARVVEMDERQIFEVALVENLQRKDLNAIEKAQAFQGYVAKFAVTHEKLAGQLGVDRSTVTNLLRLLELPDEVQTAVRLGRITNGHARALLTLDDPQERIALCRRVVTEGLSVREVESLVRGEKRGEKPPAPTSDESVKAKPQRSHHIASLEADLRKRLNVKIDIKPTAKDKGSIVLHFESNDDFERIVGLLNS